MYLIISIFSVCGSKKWMLARWYYLII
jgi:hypothetical protein